MHLWSAIRKLYGILREFSVAVTQTEFLFQTSPVLLSCHAGSTAGGGGIPYGGQNVEAPPKRGAFFKLAVYKRVGKIAI